MRSQEGFTIPEFLTAAVVGLIVLTLALSIATTGRRMMKSDFERTKLHQSLRAAADIIGIDIRIAGENLSSNFPAIEVINGVDASDQIVLRRNLVSEVLTLCAPLTAGSSASQVIFASGDGTVDTGIQSGSCVFADDGQRQNFFSWRNFREDRGGEVSAYIYDTISGEGEFFTYSGEIETTDSFLIERQSGTWENDYNYLTSSVYLLEEHRYRVVDGLLELVRNQDWSSPLVVANNLEDFQATLVLEDESEEEELLSGDPLSWADLRRLRIEVRGSERFWKEVEERRFTVEYFPRNVLSQ